MALLTGEPRTATVIALTEVELLKIAKEHFDELLDCSPRLRQAVEALNSQRILQNVAALRAQADAADWQQLALANIQRLSRKEEAALMQKHAAAGAPLALFLGALLDGIPESLVIGSSFVGLDSFRFTFLAAVFLSNLPEAIGSAVGMQQAGFSTQRIFTLWGLLVLVGALAAALGNFSGRRAAGDAHPGWSHRRRRHSGDGVIGDDAGSLRGRRTGRWAGDHCRLSHLFPVQLPMNARTRLAHRLGLWRSC